MEDWHWIVFAATVAVFGGLLFWRRRPETDGKEPAPDAAKPAAPASSPADAAEPAQPKPPDIKSKDIPRHPAPEIPPSQANLPVLGYEEDDDIDPTKLGAAATGTPRKLQPPTKKIVYDADAAVDEPTRAAAIILVTAQAQTDKGLRRKRNEDSILSLPELGVFVVADGMGGYQGGEIASALAVKTIETAYRTNEFAAEPHESLPARASELARAIQMANEAILERAETDQSLKGMGTTVCAVRFVANKGRLYVGHVGDSRLYRVRGGELRRMTSDHTMKDLGVTGPQAAHLSRAVGIWPTVAIDIVLGTPQPGDLYILCSDGLTKMVDDGEIGKIATPSKSPSDIVDDLVKTANANGGKDNVSVIVVRVLSATDPSAR